MVPKVSVIDSYDGIFVYVQVVVVTLFMLLGILLNNVGYRSVDTAEARTYKLTADEIALSAVAYSFILSLFGTHINIAGRVSRYFIVFFLIFLPAHLEKVKDPKTRGLLYYFLILVLMSFYFVILYMRPEWDGVVPFRWIWD